MTGSRTRTETKESNTKFGTRLLGLVTGGTLTLRKGEDDDAIGFSIRVDKGRVSPCTDPDQRTIDVALTQSEALTLVEYLAAAAQPGSGKDYVDVGAELAALKENTPWRNGRYVYVHGRDLFGRCVTDEQNGKVMVKLDFPWNHTSPPEECVAERLEDGDAVRRRYE